MVNVIYNDSIPDGPNNPSQDQPKMQTNTNSTRKLIEVDHIGFGNDQGGYHLPIHQPPQSTWDQVTRVAAPPLAAIVGVNQILSMNVTPDTTGGTVDTQLFNLTGGGGVSQLTGNFINQEGYAWVGGILVMWGRVTTAALGGAVVFKDRAGTPSTIKFPSTCFGVILQNATGSVSKILTVSSLFTTDTGFTWASNVGTNDFYWWAWGI